jgi:zinc transporter
VIPATRPSLIWAFEFAEGAAVPLDRPDERTGEPGRDPFEDALPPTGHLRWFHVNFADQSSCRWIAALKVLPEAVRDLILSPEGHQRALVDRGYVALVLHDFEVDFGKDETSRVGALQVAIGPGLVITARHHPLHAADIVKRRIDAGARPSGPAEALDLLVTAIASSAARSTQAMTAKIQGSEDVLLADGWEPDPRDLVAWRRRSVQLHRQLSGLRGVLLRLEEDEDLPPILLPAVERLGQRVAALDSDVVSAQSDLRLLRDELDLQAQRRTNRNLYVLSILSALLLPATLVTGFFGMNTAGMPFQHSPVGTVFAGLVAAASAGAVYVWLRRQGFLDGK